METEELRQRLIKEKDKTVLEVKTELIECINNLDEKTLLRFLGVRNNPYKRLSTQKIIQIMFEKVGTGFWQIDLFEKSIDTEI